MNKNTKNVIFFLICLALFVFASTYQSEADNYVDMSDEDPFNREYLLILE